VGAGDYESADQDSTVSWTPVGSDPTGAGNDERLRASDAGSLVLDGKDGGRITGILAFEGRIVVFKDKRVYFLTGTQVRTNAYLPAVVSRTFGAMEYSIVEGQDALGRACVYFVDSIQGPMRLGAQGFEVLMPALQDQFAEDVGGGAAVSATRRVATCYYRSRQQVWWTFAVNGNPVTPYPTMCWVYDIRNGRPGPGGGSGRVRYTMPNAILSSVIFSEQPHHAAFFDRLVRSDELGATSDYGSGFRAYVRTRAAELGSLFAYAGIKAVVLQAVALAATSISVSLIRDYGKETRTVSLSLAPVGSETYVSVPVDNATISEALAVQFEYGDASPVSVGTWSVERLAVKWSLQGSSIL
jgi:hypothetical protein